MINKKVNAEEQIQRMKSLMNYGLTESKEPAYSGVEYTKEAGDGKLYGIIREGAKYYIKVAKNPKGELISENFDYIGGFRNRKENMFESFASAQRYFVEKMACINESIDNKREHIISESWDINAKNEVAEESTRKMREEINRQRQIMRNVNNINEGKSCDMIGGCPKPKETKTEEPKSQPGAPFTQTLNNSDIKSNQEDNIKDKKEPVKGNKKQTNESTEVPLVSRKNPDYMDTTHGTEKGNNAPYSEDVDGASANTENNDSEYDVEEVNENVVMHDSQNQNSPAVGVGEKGDNQPFDKDVNITEDVDDLGDELDDDDDDVDFGDEEIDDSGEGIDDSEEDVDGEYGDEDSSEDIDGELPVEDSGDEDINVRLSTLEDKMNQILDAINNMKYDSDDTLYDEENGEEVGDEEDVDDEVEVVESKSYKEMMKKQLKEEDDFGKHPAFQKTVMTTPSNKNPKKDGQYDMNDDSVDSEQPYATNKGNQKPFEQPTEQIENAITEAVMKMLKKKLA